MSERLGYKAPSLTKIGSVKDLTLGSGGTGPQDGKSGTYKPVIVPS